MKVLFLVFCLITSLEVMARGKSGGFEIDPYFSATKGDYEFENSYKGSLSAIGLGARAGSTLGPLYFAFDVHGQMPWYNENDDATETQTDLSPIPSFDFWLSMGLAAGIKTRLFSLTYTHYFKSDLKAKARYDRTPSPDEKVDYQYHGTGSKISALLHLTKNISLGAEIANYTFDKYSIDKATHVIGAGKEKGRDNLTVATQSILINYHIPITVK